MPKIAPNMLKACREAKQLTQDELAEKSRVDKGTISRIERGHCDVRGSTLKKLCKCLDVTPEILAGTQPLPEVSFDEKYESKSQLNIRIRDGARNALQLVSARYRIPSTYVIELAPFLFEWAATESLKLRRNGVDRLESVLAQADEARRATLAHLHAAVSNSWRSDEILSAEKWSIDKMDIWGTYLEADDDQVVPEDYQEAEDNPFVQFLKRLGDQTGGTAEFDFWWDSGPTYSVCRAEALELAGGDEKIAASITGGAIPLHEMPKELRLSPNNEERMAWLKLRHSQAMQKLAEDFPELADIAEAIGDKPQ